MGQLVLCLWLIPFLQVLLFYVNEFYDEFFADLVPEKWRILVPVALAFVLAECNALKLATSYTPSSVRTTMRYRLSVWFARKSSWPRSVHSLLLLSIPLSLIFSVIIVLFLSRISESSKSRWWFMFHIWRYVLGLSLFQCRDLNCVILGVRALLFWTIPSIFTPGWYTHCFTCQLHWVASS